MSTSNSPLKIATEVLEIAYLQFGASSDRVALLLHGWPDDATTWLPVAERLSAQGIRSVVPWLRGFGETRFRSPSTCRDGRTEALAQDALDLMDELDISQFHVIGHDWGARAAYALAALAPERLKSVVALSLGYSPRGEFPVPPFEQSRAWWYQWFMSTDGGAAAVAKDPKGFARIQWETWSPRGWFDERTFDAVARSFENPDWLAITLNGYRSRWRDEPRDQRYDSLHARIAAVDAITVPSLMIQGSYRRVVLDGVGHFPSREAPEAVTNLILEHCSER
jgi:pimeloyl-ACP methyl ester carboxylesterase